MGESWTVKTEQHLQALCAEARLAFNVGKPMTFTIEREIRTTDQNSKMWPMLTDVANQVRLVVNGAEQWASPEDWKDVFTAALLNERRVAKGLDEKAVLLGLRTSKMKKAEFSDLIELMHAYGARNNVKWSAPSLKVYEQYKEAQTA